MEQHRTRWPVVQWLRWCCLMSALREGRACVDSSTVVDSNGDGCHWYSENASACGQHDTATFTAARDCCASCCNNPPCGCVDDATGGTDSGGDNCSFYDERPEFCGCCDTPSFIAERDCCACGHSPQGTGAWWTEVFHAWPRKAVSLHLEGKGLQGPLPPTLNLLLKLKSLRLKGNDLTGNVPPELGNLSGLEYVDLSSNQLSGSLPAELGRLSQLRVLNLIGNQLSGSLPAELGQLLQLQDLRLQSNQLSGSLPAELGQLSQLRVLNLVGNQLSGSLPAELGRLSQLQTLQLNHNQLSGSLPAELGQLSQLQMLRLNHNQLSGSLPAELGQLSQLRWLVLFNNQLSGSLPAELGQLSLLFWVSLNNNQLSGSLPAELGQLSLLFWLTLENNQLSGSLPAELGQLSRLSHLRLNNNQFSGGLPAELGRLSQLGRLTLEHNQLSGNLPAELGRLSQLGTLSLQHNQLNGRLPAELGGLSRLQSLRLEHNQLSGSLPAELGRLSRLEELHLEHNQLNGSLPAELGKLSRLQSLRLDHNQLEGGIPNTYGNMSRLQLFSAAHNPHLCGSTDAITELHSLRTLELRGCCFQTFAPLPAGLEVLDLGANHLTAVPESLLEFREFNLTRLLLDNNRIRLWDTSSVLALSERLDRVLDGTSTCQYDRLQDDGRPRPRQWMKLVRLDVSGNSMGLPVYDFLATLRDLPVLAELRAADNHLSGPVPAPLYDADEFIDPCIREDVEGTPLYPPGFPELVTLDLSGNDITYVHAPPPPSLVELYLARNRLTTEGLGYRWWRESATSRTLQLVDVRDNPALRLPIQLPFLANAVSSCEDSRADELAADPLGWVPAPGDAAGSAAAGSECTELCTTRPRLELDPSAQEEVLCRCAKGQGSGRNCTACPGDTYSVQSFDHERGHYMRSCRGCPRHSELSNVSAGLCFADCHCLAGYFMQKIAPGGNATEQGGNATELGSDTCRVLLQREDELAGNCQSCGIWKTSQTGSRTEAGCFCNADRWSGLLQEGAECRCPEGQSIDFMRRRCVECAASETCTDGADSLHPPQLKEGYWALPPPPKGDGTYGGFSRHSIWRCDSGAACPGNFTCGQNRTGTACSLCRRGFFRSSGGGCLLCPRGYMATRLLFLAVLLACTIFPLMAHGLLTVADDGSPRGMVISTSLKQILKFAQVLSIVSLFQVEWPPAVLSIFRVVRTVSVDLASWMGIACLDTEQQETVVLEVSLRWVLPLLAAIVTAISAVVATTCGLLCLQRRETETKLGRLLSFRHWDVLRVLLFFLQLFYPSILNNALLPLTCSPSPNGKLTLNFYPHMECLVSFWPLAVLGGIYAVLLIGGYPFLLFRLKRHLPDLDCWWAFIFEDYRPDRRYFALVVVGKDILVNLVPVVLPGLGTFQLLITALVSGAFAFCVIHVIRPFHEMSNTLLEACTSTAVAVLCIFSAGLGFQSESEVFDISAYLKGGRSNPIYFQRAVTLVCLQTVSLVVPVLIIIFQVLALFKSTRGCVPRAFRPANTEELQDQPDELAPSSAATDVEQPGSRTQDVPESTTMERPGEEPQRPGEEPLQPSQTAHETQAGVLGRASL